MSQEPPPHTRLRIPSPWVLRHAHLIPAGGRVLDVACGGGRHTRHFLERGFAVTAIDRDTAWMADLEGRPGLRIMTADLENGLSPPFCGMEFDLVIVANYLHRPLFSYLSAAVAPEGLLLYETFARGNEEYSRPRNPDHLLEPGELLAAFTPELQIIAYEYGFTNSPRPAVVQRIAATRRKNPVEIIPSVSATS